MTILLITASMIVPILIMKDPKCGRKYLVLASLHTVIYIYTCADPGIFVRGGGGGAGQSYKKALTTFFSFFFSPQLILQKSNGQFQRNLSFSRFQWGSNIFQGGGGGKEVRINPCKPSVLFVGHRQTVQTKIRR